MGLLNGTLAYSDDYEFEMNSRILRTPQKAKSSEYAPICSDIES